jgi:5' nucleotidase family
VPGDATWRDLFDIVVVQARKPSFWSDGTALLRIVSEEGLMEPAALPQVGGCYFGGSARLIEQGLKLDGDHFLYVGDHIYTDAALAKVNFKCAIAAHARACACLIWSVLALECACTPEVLPSMHQMEEIQRDNVRNHAQWATPEHFTAPNMTGRCISRTWTSGCIFATKNAHGIRDAFR